MSAERKPDNSERLRRIADMIGIRGAKAELKDRQLLPKGLEDTNVIPAFINAVMTPYSQDWLHDYDFIIRPFSLHLFRIWPRADSRRVLNGLGDWQIIEMGFIGANPAYKVERAGKKARVRQGFYDYLEFEPREKAVIVIRFDEELVEIRAKYEVARELAELLRDSMNLRQPGELIDLNEKEYKTLLAHLQAKFDQITYGILAGSAAEVILKMRDGNTIDADTKVALEMAAKNGGSVRVEDHSLQRNSGWAEISLGSAKIKCQIHRERGTFATNTLISEKEVQAVVAAFKLAKGLGSGNEAAD